MVPPSGNIIVKVFKCIVHALKMRTKERLTKPRYHWLDYAESKYGKQLVYDIKCLMKIAILCIPFPLFWALFDQQSSRWTFQATQMDGYISKSYTIKPDQVQVLNPLIVVFCIPLFNFVIYPLLAKINIKTPLQKLALGMMLCGVAFAMSGFLELSLEKTYPELPVKGEAQLRIFNGRSCGYRIETNLPDDPIIDLPPHSQWTEKHIHLRRNQTIEKFKYTVIGNDTNCETVTFDGEFKIESQRASSYFLTDLNKLVEYVDAPERSSTTLPLIRILMTGDSTADPSSVDSLGVINKQIVFQSADTENPSDSLNFHSEVRMLHEIEAGIYLIFIDHTQVGAVELKQGGTYTIVISRTASNNFVS